MERIVYPGSFRPFHLGHLEKIDHVVSCFPDAKIIVAISDDCRRASIDIDTAVKVARLSVPDEISVVAVSPNPILTARRLIDEKITHVMTGSEKTISILNLLKFSGFWNGEIIKLDNSGIHATQIRKWIESGDSQWKKHMAQPAVSFLESKM